MFDEKQALIDYINWLVEVNQASTEQLNLAKFIEVYFFGAISEVYELQEAAPENKLLEAGDVLAYSCLSLVVMGMEKETIAAMLGLYNQVVEPPLSHLTNALSKLYRGDEGNYREQVENNLLKLVYWAATVTGVTPYILSIYNREKLTKRLAANGTFQGQGDR
jgi:hypothetical protein